jgi:hypothetical protein
MFTLHRVKGGTKAFWWGEAPWGKGFNPVAGLPFPGTTVLLNLNKVPLTVLSLFFNSNHHLDFS